MIDYKALAAPFPDSDIRHRKGPGGRQLPYVTNRAIQERLDSVVGPGNWQNEFKAWEIGTPGVLCGLSIRDGNEWITKWDGAEQTDIEPVKGGLSDAMKRAAVQWGIGRYLYEDQGAGTAQPPREGTNQTREPAVQTPAQHPSGSTPLRAPGPYAPTEKQVNFFTKLMGSHVFTEEERKRGMEWLATKATRETIKDQIDHAKRTIEERTR